MYLPYCVVLYCGDLCCSCVFDGMYCILTVPLHKARTETLTDTTEKGETVRLWCMSARVGGVCVHV